ncbi:endonuclease/exonuclease/phosphatase family protein [Nocardioides aurantiacus]|uniref:Endonuclease/exonuclease/phosphatase family protein n=1 Tax=Nocardioides aurantiacus TaxID=86796 RepID=A0A3N2CWF5_9ACTN|nr:endonuclease/exonuclease/phosphatase family protein [Nocardioides aurantiacus]
MRWTAGTALATGLLLGPPLLMVAAMTGGRSEVAQGGCGDLTQVSAEVGSSAPAAGLSPEQTRNAATIVAVGRRMGISQRGQVVALATASQESRFLNYANDGLGGDLSADQRGVGRSLELPHQAVGSDHGSIGLFQQQWPWWGSMSELMDPATSAVKFYEKLRQVPGWQAMPVTRAAQAVQRSAYPDAYADDEALAVRLIGQLGGADVSNAATTSADCSTTDVVDGRVTTPVSTRTAGSDRRNFGSSGGRWARGHTGTDFSLSCGTPVLAATSGRVVIETDQGWAGRWLVKVSTGEGALTTWYAHMQRVLVSDGAVVRAGQQIGEVGTLGNSTGCHLHFEVHPRGGSIYEDPVDPSEWLSRHVGETAPQVQSVAARPATGGSDFVLASFNVLGHSHTGPRGNKAHWASGVSRMSRAIGMLDSYEVDVVGFQELQRAQYDVLTRTAGDRYAIYVPPSSTEISVAWRRDRWTFVSADTVPVPSWKGRIKDMPLVRLRHVASGQEAIFFSVHNAASIGGPAAPRHRAEAVRRELATMRAVTDRYDVPAFLLGDMNERIPAFCGLTKGQVLSTPAGGSHATECRLPKRLGIDWIFGNRHARWLGYTVDWATSRSQVSDHPLVVARVGLGRTS